jgi:hypothetical protein
MAAATYRAEELADLAGISTYLLYSTIRAGSCPFPFVRVGRRVLFVKAGCDRLLGIDSQPLEPPGA